MHRRELANFVDRRLFQPFAIWVQGGFVLRVTRLSQASLNTSASTITVDGSDGAETLFLSDAIVALELLPTFDGMRRELRTLQNKQWK